jgi:LmbE family N-acetylglucosaminyl deacetylase
VGGLEGLTVRRLALAMPRSAALRVLCIGAHSDDLELGCGGTMMQWLSTRPAVEVTWIVLSASGERESEARASARALLRRAVRREVVLADFPDARFPAHFARLKALFAGLGERIVPDVILTHGLSDRHQDHRLVAELTWQTWRNQLILEYEVPQYEGAPGRPNLYVPLPGPIARRKVAHLLRHFRSQRGKDWFDERVFDALMRLRGLECRAPGGMAEAFESRKAVLEP